MVMQDFIGGKMVYIGGNLGKGKTVTCAKMLFEDWLLGKKIYSDFHLDFPSKEEMRELGYIVEDPEFLAIRSNVDLRRFLRMMEDNELDNCTVGFDEFYLTAGSNRSASLVNQIIVAYATTIRKGATDLYLVSPEETDIDRKVRRYIHLELHPNLDEKTGLCRVKIYNRKYKEWSTLTYDAKEIFPLYNTREKPGIPQYLKKATFTR